MDILNKEAVFKEIESVLNIDGIHACFLFGSYGTDEFTKDSDIDLAIISDIPIYDLGLIVLELEDKLGISIDLLDVNDLDGIFKLQIAYRNEVIFSKNDKLLEEFYSDVQFWYDTDFRLYKAWSESDW